MSKTLSESASKELLAAFGLPVPTEHIAADAEAAVAAAEDVGYPCVLKLCGDAIAHKTERNLVRLGLGSHEQVSVAATELLDAATDADGDVALLVAPMIRSNREFIVGADRPDEFGPVVMFGVGGVLAEAVEDVVFRLVPLDATAAAAMLDELRSQALLGPFRGEPAVDRVAMAQVIGAVAQAMQDRPEILAIDVNPVLIAHGRPVAVDALVELR